MPKRKKHKKAQLSSNQNTSIVTKVSTPVITPKPVQATTPQQQPASKIGLWQIIGILISVRLFSVIWGMLVAPFSKKQTALEQRLEGEITDITVATNSDTANFQHQHRWVNLLKDYTSHTARQKQNMPSLDVLLRTSIDLLMRLPKCVSAEQWQERLQWAVCIQILFTGSETQPEYAPDLASFYHLMGTTTTAEVIDKRLVTLANQLVATYLKALQGKVGESLDAKQQTQGTLDHDMAYAVLRNALNFNGVRSVSSTDSYVQVLDAQLALLETIIDQLEDTEAVELLDLVRQKCSKRQICSAEPQLLTSMISIEERYAGLLKKTLKRMQLSAKAQIELDPQKTNLVGWLTYEYVEEDLRRLQTFIQAYANPRATHISKGGNKALTALTTYQSMLPLLVQARGLDSTQMQTLRSWLDSNLEDAQTLSKGSRKLTRLQA